MKKQKIKHYLPLAPREFGFYDPSNKSFLLYVISWMLAIVMTFIGIIRIISVPGFIYHDMLIILWVDITSLICLLLNYHGYTRLGSYILTFSSWIITSLIIFFSGGLSAPAMSAMLVLIVASGLLLQRKWAIISAFLSLLISMAAMILEIKQLLPPAHFFNSPLPVWLGYTSSGIMVGIMQYLSNLQNSYAYSQQNQLKRKYRSLVEHAGDPIFLLNQDNSFNEVNGSACNLLGYTEYEFGTINFINLIIPNEHGLAQWVNKEYQDENRSILQEVNLRKKDGAVVAVEMNVRVLEDHKYLVIARDITERKLAEQKILESEKKYRNIFENVQDVFYRTSLSGIIIDISPSIKKHIGYTREAIIGTPVIDFYYDKSERQKLLQMLMEKGEVYELELSFKSATGERVYVSSNARVSKNENGDPEFIDGFFKNITERKQAELKLRQSEEKHRALTENISDAILLLDATGKIIYHSAAVERIGGFTYDDLHDKSAFDFFHPEDLQDSIALFRQIIAQPGLSAQNQFRCIHKKGHYIWLEGTIVNLMLNDSVNAILINYRNITERVKQLKDIEEQNEKLKEIAWIQSHVVRAPLTRMMAIVNLLHTHDMNTTEFKEWVAHFNNSASELDTVIRHISDESMAQIGNNSTKK